MSRALEEELGFGFVESASENESLVTPQAFLAQHHSGLRTRSLLTLPGNLAIFGGGQGEIAERARLLEKPRQCFRHRVGALCSRQLVWAARQIDDHSPAHVETGEIVVARLWEVDAVAGKYEGRMRVLPLQHARGNHDTRADVRRGTAGLLQAHRRAG